MVVKFSELIGNGATIIGIEFRTNWSKMHISALLLHYCGHPCHTDRCQLTHIYVTTGIIPQNGVRRFSSHTLAQEHVYF